MAKVYRFTAKEHEDHGILGWLQKGKPGFDPGSGMIVAHDILEEFPSGQDQPQDELLALGCAYWLRGEGGYFHRRGSFVTDAAEHIASDMPEILRHVIYEDYRFPAPPPTRMLDLEDDEGDFAERIVRMAEREILEDLGEEGTGPHGQGGRLASHRVSSGQAPLPWPRSVPDV